MDKWTDGQSDSNITPSPTPTMVFSQGGIKNLYTTTMVYAQFFGLQMNYTEKLGDVNLLLYSHTY